MAVSLKQIKQPISHNMAEFEQQFRQAMKSKVPLLDKIMTFVVRHKGKQMRPMFVFLSAGTCGDVSDKTYRGASLVELLHTATLIHDDVVDTALQRRGIFSINALWQNKIAVLVGDYLLSRGLLLSLENGDFQMLQICSNAVKLMSEGELLQMEKARRLDIDELTYFDIIRMKTASLIASCCAIGAYSVGADEEQVERMRLFGEKVGIAFQIRDDLFGFGANEAGKPSNVDIQEQKMTLPLIYALTKAEKREKRQMINVVKRHNTDKAKVEMLIRQVHEFGGVNYAQDLMLQHRQEAFELLETFPDNQHRQSLHDLVVFTTERRA